VVFYSHIHVSVVPILQTTGVMSQETVTVFLTAFEYFKFCSVYSISLVEIMSKGYTACMTPVETYGLSVIMYHHHHHHHMSNYKFNFTFYEHDFNS